MFTKHNKLFIHTEKSNKSKSIAFWLCLIFGPLGLHRLYVGKMISGIFMLVPSLIASSWVYKQYNHLSETLNTALSSGDQAEQLNKLLESTNNLSTLSSWDNLLSWVTLGLLIWAIVDLVTIGLGKFTDREGRALQ
jgi:hypothetical protein